MQGVDETKPELWFKEGGVESNVAWTMPVIIGLQARLLVFGGSIPTIEPSIATGF